jgi:hypothetical protein
MKSITARRWVLAALIAVAFVVGARWAVAWGLLKTHERLVAHYCQAIETLPEERATVLVAQLASHDDQWLEVVVAATADTRPTVASSAQRELAALPSRWKSLPDVEKSRRAARLARSIARLAKDLTPERRLFAQSLAQWLLTGPATDAGDDSPQLIADCEAVLLLPATELIDLRVASVPASKQEPTQPPESAPPVPSVRTAPEPAVPEASPTIELPPTPSSPNEPRLLAPPAAERITDD